MSFKLDDAALQAAVGLTDDLSTDDYCKKANDFARVAECAERYDDMCTFMRLMIEKKIGGPLKEDEDVLDKDQRNLLSVAYKNVVGAKRSSWRTLTAGQFDDQQKDLVPKFRQQLEDELSKVCNEVITILDKVISKEKDKKDESAVFYLKMKGDYYRYLSEFQTDEGNKTKCGEMYGKAMDVAKEVLAETHPTRLGLALNYSVCFYEILKKPKEACKLAKEAFDEAIEKLDTLNDASYKDSTLIMQLLRDNLTLWTSEVQGDNEENADGTGS